MNLLLTAIGFFVVTAGFFFWLFYVLRAGIRRTTWPIEKQDRVIRNGVIVVLTWTTFLTVFALSGVSSRWDLFPLNAGPILVIPLIGIVWMTFSGKMTAILPLVSAKSLVQIQVFRVAVEILLWSLLVQNLLPIQMTFEGRNFDIISGLTAPIAAVFLVRSKVLLTIWNLLCFGLLVNIVTVALLSMPTPFRVFMNEPANSIVTTFPYILLPGMLVPLAYGLHFLSLRQTYLVRGN